MPTTVRDLRPSVCHEYPEYYFIFGDNLEQRGTAGQACIRGCPNAFGVPTKRLPSMSADSFFDDAQLEDNKRVIDHAIAKVPRDKPVWWHEMIGLGLSRMDLRCPLTYAYLGQRLSEEFGV